MSFTMLGRRVDVDFHRRVEELRIGNPSRDGGEEQAGQRPASPGDGGVVGELAGRLVVVDDGVVRLELGAG